MKDSPMHCKIPCAIYNGVWYFYSFFNFNTYVCMGYQCHQKRIHHFCVWKKNVNYRSFYYIKMFPHLLRVSWNQYKEQPMVCLFLFWLLTQGLKRMIPHREYIGLIAASVTIWLHIFCRRSRRYLREKWLSLISEHSCLDTTSESHSLSGFDDDQLSPAHWLMLSVHTMFP